MPKSSRQGISAVLETTQSGCKGEKLTDQPRMNPQNSIAQKEKLTPAKRSTSGYVGSQGPPPTQNAPLATQEGPGLSQSENEIFCRLGSCKTTSSRRFPHHRNVKLTILI